MSAFGAPVVVGEFGTFAPIAAEATASGYEVAWKATGADQYTVLNADGNGNFVSHAFFVVSGNSFALESVEASFQQDLNSDGVISLATTVIESNGSISLAQVADTYSLYQSGTSTGPQLKMSGAAVTTGQFGAWTAIGAAQAGNGYQVPWKFGAADQYIVWNTDSGGNYLSQGAVVSGNSWALQSLEISFSEDLNSDGRTGPPSTGTVIESNGSTSLAQILDSYFLYQSGTSTGPQLKFNGAYVAAGEFGAWTPLGAEQTDSGYQVVWQNGGADQYVVWDVDGNGNFLSQGAVLSAASAALQSLEPAFNQDLNHSGGITVSTVIDSSGSTGLAQSANVYLLYPTAGGAGPQLKMSGALVMAGQFGGWTPIGAEQAENGVYQVAWKNGRADQYLAWNVDSDGNYLSQGAVVSGSTWWVQSFESTLHQDLNSDGTVGPVTTTIEASGTTALAKEADFFS